MQALYVWFRALGFLKCLNLIYWLPWVLVAVRGLALVAGLRLLVATASLAVAPGLWGARVSAVVAPRLQSTSSVVVA